MTKLNLTGKHLIDCLSNLARDQVKIYTPGPDEQLIADNIITWMVAQNLSATDVVKLLEQYMKVYQLTVSITDFANCLSGIWEKYKTEIESRSNFEKILASTAARMKEIDGA